MPTVNAHSERLPSLPLTKMVFGHNLHHMAPFDFSRAGFCMEFRRASLVFSCPGVDLRDPGRISGPQVHILARGPFWTNFWIPKNILLRGNDFVVGIQGNPSCPEEFYGPWDPFRHATLHQRPQQIYVISDFPGKLQRGFPLSLIHI